MMIDTKVYAYVYRADLHHPGCLTDDNHRCYYEERACTDSACTPQPLFSHDVHSGNFDENEHCGTCLEPLLDA